MQAVVRRDSARFISSFSSTRMKLLHKSIIGTNAMASCCILPFLLVWQSCRHGTHAWITTTTTRILLKGNPRPSTRYLSATVATGDDAAVLIAEEEAAVESERTVAEGMIVSSFSGGLTAVRIKDDDWLARLTNSTTTGSNDATATATATAASLGLEAAKLTPPTTTTTKKTSMGGGDGLLGRNVAFSNGNTGVVVAHRPPLVFVYSSNDGVDGDASDASDKAAELDDGSVHVLNSMAYVSIDPVVASNNNNKLVVDAFGRGLHSAPGAEEQEKSSKNNNNKRAIFAPIPQVKDIALINNPMLTGVTMVDALAPLGQGQNMLLIGHDAQDMRKYAIDFLQTQLRQQGGDKKTGGSSTTRSTKKCVYAAVDHCDQVFDLLEKAGIKDQVHVVVPSNNDDDDDETSKKDEASIAAEAVAMAGTACAIAESYAIAPENNGLDTMVIVDTIDYHKKLWDSTTRVLVDVFGVDAVVKDDIEGGASSEMRGFYSSLIQRAGQYKKRKGGGSVTLVLLMTIPRLHVDEDTIFQECDFDKTSQKVKDRIKLLVQRNIPLTVANLRKIDIPVPSESEGELRLALQHTDDLISMSDGQVWFDEDLVNAGQRPPINPERSITRVGIGADTESRADAPAIRRIAEGLRLDLSQASNMDGAEATNASKKQIQRKNALLLAMHQESGTGGRLLSESCAVLLAASRGFLDGVVENGATAGTEQGQETMNGLLEHLWATIPRVMSKIDESLDMTNIQQKQIEDAIESFLSH